jgi:hypothetical protein
MAAQLTLWLAAIFIFFFPGNYLLGFYKLLPSGIIYPSGDFDWIIALLHFANGLSAIFGYFISAFFIHLAVIVKDRTVKFICAVMSISTLLAAATNSISIMVMVIGGEYYLIALLMSVCSTLSYLVTTLVFISNYSFIRRIGENLHLMSK